MKMKLKLSLLAITAFALAACATPTNTTTNTNTNTNTNAALKAAAPTAESLMALENKAWEAYKNKDGKYFEGFLADNMISGSGEGTMSRANTIKMITAHTEDIKSLTLSDPKITPIGADVAVLTYKGVVDGTENGKPIPSPITVATVFVRSGTDWKAAYHNEVPIIDPAKPATAANNNKSASADAGSDTSAAEKKAPPTVTNSNSAANTNASPSNSNSSASATDAALTDALMVIEKKGWEGWKAKDAKALEEVTAKDLVFVEPTGKATFSRAEVMKMWTTDNPCNVSSVSLSDGKAISIVKDVAILVVKGTAVGTCGDMKLTPLWNTSIFVKEGDAWKLTYMFETPVS